MMNTSTNATPLTDFIFKFILQRAKSQTSLPFISIKYSCKYDSYGGRTSKHIVEIKQLIQVWARLRFCVNLKCIRKTPVYTVGLEFDELFQIELSS